MAALLLLPHPVAGDERRDGLTQTRERLGEVETVLRDARADAGTVAQALEAADRAVARSRARLATATAELDRALRKQAKDKLDARVARLAGAGGALRRRSAELRRLIRQEELARRRAGRAGRGSILGPGPPCDLSGTSPAERWIVMEESSGYPTADSPTSTAFGLGQLLLGNRILYLGQDYATTDCGRQLWAFRTCVRDRYGTAERAKAFWQANGWY